MNNQSSINSLIEMINNGSKQYPAIDLVKKDPEIPALISKLVKPRDRSEFDINKKDSHYLLNQSQIQTISDTIKSRIVDNRNIMQLFPDIELAIQIIVSSILSPKDMVKTDIIYKVSNNIFSSELTMKLNTIIKDHLENHYKIHQELADILKEELFETGSYVKLVLPENALDDIINHRVDNVSIESFSEVFTPGKNGRKDQVVSLGILGNPNLPNDTVTKKPSLESLLNFDLRPATIHPVKTGDSTLDNKMSSLFEITDNFNLLKMPKAIEAVNDYKIRSIIKSKSTAIESNRKLNNHEFTNVIYKDPKARSEQFVVIPSKLNARRKSVSRPLVMRLPSESVIPVYIPGNEKQHVGYFVLIDYDGNPVTLGSNTEYLNGLSSLMTSGGQNQSQSLSSLLIKKARNNLANNEAQPSLDQITKVYASIIEKDLIDRLRNGVYKRELKISDNNEIYRIMLARMLSDQFTRLVYIPSELVTYFAFKYFDNGVGKSYLDEIKIFSSLRAIILFSKVMAMVKSSISLTHVNMTLDEKDPDPQKTIEMLTHDIVKMRQQYFPLGINSPIDLVDWIQRAGLEFTFEGHPGLPNTKLDFETRNLQHQVPDTDLDELLRKQAFMAFGLSPEDIDNASSPEFATTIINNNILRSKRILRLQELFTPQLTDHACKLIRNDPVIYQELTEALLSNEGLLEKDIPDEDIDFFKKDKDTYISMILEDYIDTLQLELPKPDITSLENQSEAYTAYEDALDKALDAWISTETIPDDIAGEVNGNIDSIRNVIKSYMLRSWQSENGYMNELNDITTMDEEGYPMLDIYEIMKNHMEGIMRSSVKFISKMRSMKNAANADLENMDVEAGESTSYSSDEDSDTSEGGDEFGMGDMGMEEDFGSMEEDTTGTEEGTDEE